MEALDLASRAPLLVWGLVARGVGLTLLIAFISLAPQVLPLAGRGGLLPVREALAAQSRDFPTWRRYLYFPTLLWLNASDRMLIALIGLGIASSLAIVIGGPQAPWAFALCFAAYLSLDRAMFLIYPWDSMLLEAAFWGAFLPAPELLPQLECVSTPHPAAAWAFRLLAFRVMFGFGKHKFFGATVQDRTFLRGFFVLQPLPTRLGVLASELPPFLHVFGLLGLFVLEIIAPFTVFVPGPLTSLSAVGTIALMVAINLCGNFGHFNWILSFVVLSWLDHATARQLSLASLATPTGIVFSVHTLIALFALPFDTWSSFTWTMLSIWRRVRLPPFSWIITLARWLAPFRVVHSYGVFPAQSVPCARLIPVTEVSWDGREWHELVYRFFPTQPQHAPRVCAPHHERFDQALIYEPYAVSETSAYRGMWGRWDPYGYGGVPVAQRLMHRVLSGNAPGDRFYDRSLERERGAPREIRVRLHLLEPETRESEREKGIWWKRELIGPHHPPQRLEDMYVEHPLPPPELWHFEDVYWLERSRLGGMMARVRRGADPHTLITEGAPELAAEIDAFWNDFAPRVRVAPATSFRGLRPRVAELREQYGRERLYSFERICGRYAALLFAKLEPAWEPSGLVRLLKPGAPALGANSLYELRLLTQYIVLQGRDAYDRVLATPQLARVYAAQMTLWSAHAFQAVFRYESLVYQSQKLRIRDAAMFAEGHRDLSPAVQDKGMSIAKRWFGGLTVSEFLKTQFGSEEDILDIPERRPRFAFDATAQVVRVDNLPRAFAQEPRSGDTPRTATSGSPATRTAGH